MAPPLNLILASLPAGEFKLIAPDLVERELKLGEVIAEAGELVSRIWFPESGAISLIEVTEDGSSVECALLGADGTFGTWALMPGSPSPWRAVVQLPGQACTLDVAAFRRHLARVPHLAETVVRFSTVLSAFISRSVVCNRFHRRDQRLARWLLEAHDRADDDDLPLTHEFLADTLGAHRPAITTALQVLEEQGLVASRGRRARVQITDRPGLEAAACECYGRLRETRRELLPYAPLPVLSSTGGVARA